MNELARRAVDCIKSQELKISEMMGGYPARIEVIGAYLVIASVDQDEPTLNWWLLCDVEKAWVDAIRDRQKDIAGCVEDLDPLSNYLWKKLEPQTTE